MRYAKILTESPSCRPTGHSRVSVVAADGRFSSRLSVVATESSGGTRPLTPADGGRLGQLKPVASEPRPPTVAAVATGGGRAGRPANQERPRVLLQPSGAVATGKSINTQFFRAVSFLAENFLLCGCFLLDYSRFIFAHS